MGGVPGDGVWLWIELNRNGTGDYTGTDCIHTGPAGLNGAAHEQGDVTWTDSGGKLTITGVALVGGRFPVTVVVSDRYGHYVGPSDSFVQGFALGEIGGTAQVQVLTDSELVCLAAAQALLGFTSEAHWLRYARKHLAGLFPYLPQQSGYNKRLRGALGLVKRVIRLLARSTDFWLDTCWIVDSTPVPCGMSRPTVQRSDLAGWAGYGYCASHSRFFWGLRLYLVCTPAGMPILWALADPKLGEREVLAAMLEVDADIAAAHEGILLISDKGFAGRDFEQLLAGYSITLLRPSRVDEQARYGEPMLKKVRQLIESVNDTLKGQLDLEGHGGRSCAGVAIRVAQRILAMAAAIWRNNQTGAPVTRSLIAYDH